MPYRPGSVTTYLTGNQTTGSFSINSPIGVQQGDLIIIGEMQPQNNATPPTSSGFSAGNFENATAINQGPAYHMGWIYKVASASEPASYTVTCFNSSNAVMAFCAAWTGRAGTIGINAKTAVAGGASPVSIGLTGGTASGGDDLLCMAMVTSNSTCSWTNPSGFSLGSAMQTATPFGNAYFGYQDNFAGGSTGTVTIVETGIASDQLGFVISLPIIGTLTLMGQIVT